VPISLIFLAFLAIAYAGCATQYYPVFPRSVAIPVAIFLNDHAPRRRNHLQ